MYSSLLGELPRPKYAANALLEGRTKSCSPCGGAGSQTHSEPPPVTVRSPTSSPPKSWVRIVTREPAAAFLTASEKLGGLRIASTRNASITVDLPALFGPTMRVSPLPGWALG